MIKKYFVHCRTCGKELILKKSCRRVYLLCRSCSSEYPIKKFADSMDDVFEERLANIRCDRL